MNKLKNFSKRLMKNNRGQGMVEYILILVAVVAIVMAVRPLLQDYVSGDMMGQLKERIGAAMSQQ